MPTDRPSKRINPVLLPEVKFENLTDGPLREPLGTEVYRHGWFSLTQLEQAGFSAGHRVFFLLDNVR